MSAPRVEHKVTVRVGGHVIEPWTSYRVTSDMLQPADSFTVTMGGATPALYRLCKPDTPVQILVDDTTIITGFIDDRTRWSGREGSFLEITGRDKGGRLVDESCELRSFDGLTLRQATTSIVAPWFGKVITSNADNRTKLRGSTARKIRYGKEPLGPNDATPGRFKKVHPGETRWQVLEAFLEETGDIAWSTADGSAIVIGKPNYDQEIAYRFFLPAPGSKRAREGNVIGVTEQESTAERYSEVIALATGRGSATDFGEAVRHKAIAKNGPGKHGEGKDFSARKTLIISDDHIRNDAKARARAEHEMAVRDGHGKSVTIRVSGHTQTSDGRADALFAFDTMAWFEDEEYEISAPYLITGAEFSKSREQNEETSLHLVPKGTVLRQ